MKSLFELNVERLEAIVIAIKKQLKEQYNLGYDRGYDRGYAQALLDIRLKFSIPDDEKDCFEENDTKSPSLGDLLKQKMEEEEVMSYA